MYINSLGMGGSNAQPVQSGSGKTSGVSTYPYDTVMRKALEKQNAAVSAASGGDMIITQPFCDRNTTLQKEISEQMKSDMTMQEYRQWFRERAAQIQAESGADSLYLSDMLIIKEEAFEKMKSDPAWEKEALDRIREHCTGKETAGMRKIGYQIIGDSPENCLEEEIPVKTTAASLSSLYSLTNTSSPYSTSPYGAFTYGVPYAGSFYTGLPYAGNSWLSSGGYWNQMMTTGQAGLLKGQNGSGALASGAYQSVLNGGLGSSLLGNFMI